MDGTPAGDEDEAYVSSEDEDFNPSAVIANQDVWSSSEDENIEDPAGLHDGDKQYQKTDKRGKKDKEAEDFGFENSGDEVTIKKGTKRKRKADIGEDDSEGEGGFVKTRSMRAVVEQAKKKPLANADGATIDVEALWKSMKLGETLPFVVPPTSESPTSKSPTRPPKGTQIDKCDMVAAPIATSGAESYHKDLVTIPHPRMVDGTLTQVYKTVLRSSEEARLYSQTHSNVLPIMRSIPQRRVSKWDPNPEGTIRGLPSDIVQTGEKLILLDVHQGQRLKATNKSHLPDWPPPPNVPTTREINWRKPQDSAGAVKKWKIVAPKEQKMNVVDKSKMDWEAHVEQEGDREELVQAAKAKGAYLDKVDFLERTEMNREEELRIARRA